jgi:hypothetical protein
MHTITLREFVASFEIVSWDKLSRKPVVKMVWTVAKLEPVNDDKELALSPRQWEEPSCSSNPQSDIPSEEHLKILLRFLPKHAFTILSLHLNSIFTIEIILEAIEETHCTWPSCTTIQRVVSLVQGNEEYLWEELGVALNEVSWQYIRCLHIYTDREITFRGTYRYLPLSFLGRTQGLFLQWSLL